MIPTAEALSALSREDMVYHMLRMHQELEQLKRLIYGSRSEWFVPAVSVNAVQLTLLEVEPAAAPVTEPDTVSYQRNKPADKAVKVAHPGRMTFPAHLPREREIIEPAGLTEEYHKIGEEVTQELEYRPGSLYVRELVRPKYARKNGQGVIIAPLPLRPIHKAMAGAGLLTQMVVEKYVDAIPLYRQIERYKRDGITLSPATLNEWLTETCKLLSPLYTLIGGKIRGAPVLKAYETPVKVLDKSKKGTTHRGCLWVFLDPQDGYVYFDYQPGRGKENLKLALPDYKGTIQCDGYSVYQSVFQDDENVKLIHCWAHVRRLFFESKSADAVNAETGLTFIGALYDVERLAREGNLAAEQFTALRQEKSVPVLTEMKEWLITRMQVLNPTNPVYKAAQYTLKLWPGLIHYTTDGRLAIDNNEAKNAIRPSAIGKKNFMFFGSHEGGERAAMLYTFMGTCKKQGVNPAAWLKDILLRLPYFKKYQSLKELLPQNWVITKTLN